MWSLQACFKESIVLSEMWYMGMQELFSELVIIGLTTSPKSNCNHHFVEGNKFLVSKIQELYIKCAFHREGCLKACKVKDIESHEKTCKFKTNDSSQDNDICPKCNFKLSEEHNCIEILEDNLESSEMKLKVLKEENSEMTKKVNDLEKMKEDEKLILGKKIALFKKEKESLAATIKETKKDLMKEITINRDKLQSKVTLLENNSNERMVRYQKSLQDDFSSFEKKLKDITGIFVENSKKRVIFLLNHFS